MGPAGPPPHQASVTRLWQVQEVACPPESSHPPAHGKSASPSQPRSEWRGLVPQGARRWVSWGWTPKWQTVVQSISHVRLFTTPWTAARQAALPFTVSWSLLKLVSTELMMSSNHLIFCQTPSPPAFNLS